MESLQMALAPNQISVVVPYFNAPEKLALTLAALSHQQVGAPLEVIVVDDGSSPPLTLDSIDTPTLDLVVLRQEDQGFRLARARNYGAETARGEAVVFLDCDMIPESQWLGEHCAALRQHALALSLGFRTHIELSAQQRPKIEAQLSTGLPAETIFRDFSSQTPGWIEFHMARTQDLVIDPKRDIFRVVTGGNLGVHLEFFREVGGFDESFMQWGNEDLEFGARAYRRGAEFVASRGARCFHQGFGIEPDPGEAESQAEQQPRLAHLIPHPSFRSGSHGRIFERPRVLVRLPIDHAASLHHAVSAVESVLADPFSDLAIEPVLNGRPTWLTLFKREFAPDPRVVKTADPLDYELVVDVEVSGTVRTELVGEAVRAVSQHDCVELWHRGKRQATIFRPRETRRQAVGSLAVDVVVEVTQRSIPRHEQRQRLSSSAVSTLGKWVKRLPIPMQVRLGALVARWQSRRSAS